MNPPSPPLLAFNAPVSPRAARALRALYGALLALDLLILALFLFSPQQSAGLNLPLILLCGALGFWNWRHFTDAVLLVLPWLTVVPGIFGFPAYSPAELALLAGFAALLARGVIAPRVPSGNCPLTPALLLFGALAALSLLDGLLAGGYPHPRYFRLALLSGLAHVPFFDQSDPDHLYSAALLLIEGVILFHLVLARIQERPGRDRLLKILLLSGAVTVAAGVLQFFLEFNLTAFWALEQDVKRLQAFWGDPNSCASHLLLIAATALAMREGGLERGRFKLSVIVFALAIVTLLGTFSHAAWLGLALLVAGYALLDRFDPAHVLVAFYQRRKLALALCLVLLLGFGMFALTLDVGDPHRLDWLMDEGAGSRLFHGRFAIWRRCLLLLADSPWFGVHCGSAYLELIHFWDAGRGGWNPAFENAHNQFLQYYTELGLPGGTLFVLIVLLLVWRAFQGACQFPHQSGERRIRVCLGLGMLAFCSTLFTGHPLVLKELFYLFMVYAALLYAPGPADAGLPRLRAFRRCDPWLPAWGLALLLLVLVAARSSRRDLQIIRATGISFKPPDAAGAVGAWGERTVRVFYRKTTPLLVLNFAAPVLPPPLTAVISVNGETLDRLRVTQTGWQTRRYQLGAKYQGKLIELEIRFDRSWRPAELDPAARDRRALTAQFRNLFGGINAPIEVDG